VLGNDFSKLPTSCLQETFNIVRSKSFENIYPNAIDPAPVRVCIGATFVVYPLAFLVLDADQFFAAMSRSKDAGE